MIKGEKNLLWLLAQMLEIIGQKPCRMWTVVKKASEIEWKSWLDPVMFLKICFSGLGMWKKTLQKCPAQHLLSFSILLLLAIEQLCCPLWCQPLLLKFSVMFYALLTFGAEYKHVHTFFRWFWQLLPPFGPHQETFCKRGIVRISSD